MAAPPTGPTDLTGQTAVVTGAARGIGAGTARALSRAGARVIAVDILDCTETCGVITAEGGVAEFVQVDLSDRNAAQQAIEALSDRLGAIDILVAAAGIMPTGSVTSSWDQWDHVQAVNVDGVHAVVRSLWPHMVARGYGKIVLVTSIAAYVGGRIAGSEYMTSKGALLGLGRNLARNGAAHGIYCNIVAPGVIETGMNASLAKPDPSEIPMGRLGTPEDVAEPIVFLASAASNYITGAVIPINGGQLFSA